MNRIPILIAATASVLLTAVDSHAQSAAPAPGFSYADLADRALAAPVAVIATMGPAPIAARALALKLAGGSR